MPLSVFTHTFPLALAAVISDSETVGTARLAEPVVAVLAFLAVGFSGTWDAPFSAIPLAPVAGVTLVPETLDSAGFFAFVPAFFSALVAAPAACSDWGVGGVCARINVIAPMQTGMILRTFILLPLRMLDAAGRATNVLVEFLKGILGLAEIPGKASTSCFRRKGRVLDIKLNQAKFTSRCVHR
jgi:hypothetical protein